MSKVVTFSRGADYLHQRAMSNRREGSMLDALDLMRGALEREKDNLVYQMDLAELYCELGCHRQSIRILLAVLSGEEPLAECLFGICCNYVGMRDYTAAHSLMLWFLALDPESIERQEVAETLGMLVQHQMDERGLGTRKRRVQHMEEKSRKLLKVGDKDGALEALLRAYRISPHDEAISASLALVMGSVGMESEARAVMERVLSAEDVSARTRYSAVAMYAELGEMGLAREQLDGLIAMDRDFDEEYMVIHAASLLGADQLVLESANALLRIAPYNCGLLHRKAVALTNLGGEAAQDAVQCWERIKRIDPADSVARYCAQAGADGVLAGTRMEYNGDVPHPERMARLQFVVDAMEREGAALAWDESVRFRSMLDWMVRSRDSAVCHTALEILLGLDRPEVAPLIRECLLRPDLRRAQQEKITGYLSMRGHRPPYIAPDTLGRMADISAPNSGSFSYSPAQRRVLTNAFRMSEAIRGRRAATVEAAWRQYLEGREAHPPQIKRPVAWSAALAANALGILGDGEAMERLARAIGCPPRMVAHCARRMIAGAQPKEETTDETD